MRPKEFLLGSADAYRRDAGALALSHQQVRRLNSLPPRLVLPSNNGQFSCSIIAHQSSGIWLPQGTLARCSM
jgi:hypothetical protein